MQQDINIKVSWFEYMQESGVVQWLRVETRDREIMGIARGLRTMANAVL